MNRMPPALHRSSTARFTFVILAAGALAAACGTSPDASQAASTPPPAGASATTVSPAPTHDGMDMSGASASDGMPTSSTAAADDAAASAIAERGEEIPEGDPVPTLMLTTAGGSHGIWSFRVDTDATLTMATGPYQPMRGHLHVYVDGEEKLMIADKSFTLRDLGPGSHTIRVALAATDHRNLLHRGKPVSASTVIDVQ
jgi:hypothetical protein